MTCRVTKVELGQIIGTITLESISRSESARPAEAFRWVLADPKLSDRPRPARRGAGGFYWGFAN